jgi:hypothetical protein
MRDDRLKNVFEQASKDFNSTEANGDGYKGYLSYGIKIVSDEKTNEIYIYNTAINGDFYDEVTPEQYELFLDRGWKCGVYTISLSNYRRKLDVIQSKMRDIVNNSRSEKQMQKLREQRDMIMDRYNQLAVKLNQLNYE